ncbi:MAG: hypothetical protein ABS942_08590 [Solibacillus sp.]|uniref:hypothetical protein n=1 Tax=Solibacillus sp. TaxID=1909654 RepID=UPI003315405D
MEGPEKIGDYQISILASFLVVRALAYYALRGEEFVTTNNKETFIRNRMKALNHISWESCQPLWQQFNGNYRAGGQLYFLQNSKKTLNSIIDWLCLQGGDVVLENSY